MKIILEILNRAILLFFRFFTVDDNFTFFPCTTNGHRLEIEHGVPQGNLILNICLFSKLSRQGRFKSI